VNTRLLVLAFSGAVASQTPLIPTLARLDALKLASIEGEVPVRYSRSVSRDVASAVASRIADCRDLLGAAAGRPSIVLAVLDAPDWKRVTERPYGMAHHVSDLPNVIVTPGAGGMLSRGSPRSERASQARSENRRSIASFTRSRCTNWDTC